MTTSSQQIDIELLIAEFVDDAAISIHAACKSECFGMSFFVLKNLGSAKCICTCLYSVYIPGVYVNFLTTSSGKMDKTVWGSIVDDILYDNFTKHHLSSNLLVQVQQASLQLGSNSKHMFSEVVEDKRHLSETFY